MSSDFIDRYPSLYEQRLMPEADEIFSRNILIIDEFTRKQALGEFDRSDVGQILLDLLPESYRDLPDGMSANGQDRFDINRIFTQKLRDNYGGGTIYTYDEPESRTNVWEFARWRKPFYVVVTNKKLEDASLEPAEIIISSEIPAVLVAMEQYNKAHADKPKYLFTAEFLSRQDKISGFIKRMRSK